MFEFHLPSSMSTALIIGVVAGIIILLYKCAKAKGATKGQARNMDIGQMSKSLPQTWNPMFFSTPRFTRRMFNPYSTQTYDTTVGNSSHGRMKTEEKVLKDISVEIPPTHIYDTVHETKNESKKRPFIVYS